MKFERSKDERCFTFAGSKLPRQYKKRKVNNSSITNNKGNHRFSLAFLLMSIIFSLARYYVFDKMYLLLR